MKIIKVLFFITMLSFAVSACVSTTNVMKSWVGSDESELLIKWGAPDSSAQINDGKKVLTWKTQWSDGGYLRTCRKTFIIGSDGKVERWSYAGCPAFQLK